nr:hypothetical protein [Halogeometricum sp. CBA1124]
MSVTEGRNLDALVAAVRDRLPTATATLSMPTGDDAMSVVSWAYDHATVDAVEYGPEAVTLTLRGRPDVVERARGRAEAVESAGSS